MKKCAPFGRSTAFEAALHPTGRRRAGHGSDRDRAALSSQARIQAVIARLAHYPESGQRTSHPRLRRIVVVPFPYLVFYEVTDEEIIIHAVRHGARDPGSIPGAECS